MSGDLKRATEVRKEQAADPERIKQRFMLKVMLEESGCWMWIGARFSGLGYGAFFMLGKTEYAHRASFRIFKGPIPTGLEILHSCDNRWCVKPDHLSADTHQQNMQDISDRGRRVRGSAKITEMQAAALKAEYVKRDGELVRLSEKYGIKVSAVQAIVSGRTWSDVSAFGEVGPTEFFSHRHRGEAHHKAKIDEDHVRDIRQAHADGVSLSAIAEWFCISKSSASECIRRKTWQHVQ